MRKNKKNLVIDLVVIAVSVVFAIWLSQSELLIEILNKTQQSKFWGSLIGGLFFTSIFTTAPAIVVLSDVAQTNSAIYVAAVGALGALLGDMLMFKFLRDRVAKDFYALFHVDPNQRYFRIPRFRWLSVLLGGFIIASPFPDELGLAILGFSNTKTNWVVPISYFFNFLGILAIASIVN